MIAEIKKEFSTSQNLFFYSIYINGQFQTSSIDLDTAKLKLQVMKENILNPKPSETIYTEEF
jgi:hypothetical protein